jgi:hypothetical protein
MPKKEDAEKGRTWPPESAREHLREAKVEMRETIRALFPPAFLEHRRAARRQLLLAARELIDDALERSEPG